MIYTISNKQCLCYTQLNKFSAQTPAFKNHRSSICPSFLIWPSRTSRFLLALLNTTSVWWMIALFLSLFLFFQSPCLEWMWLYQFCRENSFSSHWSSITAHIATRVAVIIPIWMCSLCVECCLEIASANLFQAHNMGPHSPVLLPCLSVKQTG